MARFISPDTIDPRLENPQTLNRYSHALDNPVKFVDPNGHFAFIPFLVAGAAAFAWDAFHTPDIANGPKTENEIVQSPSVLDHFGSLVTGATIGFAGASAFVKEGIQAGVKATVGEIIQAESPVPIGSNSLAKGTKDLASKFETWGNPATLNDHFRKHAADFGAKSEAEYAQKASDFFKQGQIQGLPTKIDPKTGVIRMYDSETNSFAFNPDGTTATFFKPPSPSYFDRQPGVEPFNFQGKSP